MSGLTVCDSPSRSRRNRPDEVGAMGMDRQPTQRWRLRVTGQVQGVGFRPFVYRLACEIGVRGHVLNDERGVTIEAQGEPDCLDRFAQRLRDESPPLATVNDLAVTKGLPLAAESGFHIIGSRATGAAAAAVTVDVALCGDCRRELLTPADRRYRYALINCTNCGPRYTIVRDVPYDRPNTTMAGFAMCDTCGREYENAADRRFHAQPIACHDCGPTLSLVTPGGEPIAGDPIAGCVGRLMAGGIVAIKGLGGFHLAARAGDEAAVARLRQRKRRDAKPFALMCATVEAAEQLVALSAEGAAALRSPAAPIVLAPRRDDAVVSSDVAAGTHRLGVMLPYTPIQHLIFAEGGRAMGPLVMTSANASDEPLVIDHADALRRLGSLCDAMLWHDRPIERCVDDSVLIDMAGAAPLPIRRSRGFVPSELPLPMTVDDGLCVGGELKNTVAVVRGGHAVLSQHLGDLKHPLAYKHFQRALADMRRLFSVRPRWIAHDLHPLYMSGYHARQLAERLGAALVPVQHHHAHAAAVLAEHRRCDRVLAVVCDGVGFGSDGTLWGGELLLADLLDFTRLAHLRPLRLAGGDAAAKDTRRCALGLLYQTDGDGFVDLAAAARVVPDHTERSMLGAMIRRNVNCVETSAAGRVFDGIAALLGLCRHNRFEAEAAMALEAAAAGRPAIDGDRLYSIREGCIDLAPLIRHIAQSPLPPDALAGLFHDQLAAAWAEATRQAAEEHGISTVVMSGGVFCNQRLTERLSALLESAGLEVLRHRVVPPNDGGLALGQAAIASARIAAGAVVLPREPATGSTIACRLARPEEDQS